MPSAQKNSLTYMTSTVSRRYSEFLQKKYPVRYLELKDTIHFKYMQLLDSKKDDELSSNIGKNHSNYKKVLRYYFFAVSSAASEHGLGKKSHRLFNSTMLEIIDDPNFPFDQLQMPFFLSKEFDADKISELRAIADQDSLKAFFESFSKELKLNFQLVQFLDDTPAPRILRHSMIALGTVYVEFLKQAGFEEIAYQFFQPD